MIAFVLLLAGWSLLAASQQKQFSRVFHARPPSAPLRMAMRGAGLALAVAALAILLRSDSVAFATLSWVCLLSVSAMIVVLMLAWLPRWIPAGRRQAASVTGRRQRT
jgi:hypothetical protein